MIFSPVKMNAGAVDRNIHLMGARAALGRRPQLATSTQRNLVSDGAVKALADQDPDLDLEHVSQLACLGV